MKKSDKIEVLKEIWTNIPKYEREQVSLPKEDIVKKFLNLFHPGEFFYLFFNTSTTTMEYISPDIEPILGYSANDFNLSIFLNIVHPEDRPYYFYHEKRATDFFGKLPQEKLTRYKFSHDFRMRCENGNYKRLLVQVIPIYFLENGGARTLCVFTDISYLKMYGKSQLSFIGLDGEPSFYNVELNDEFKTISLPFTRREIEILKHTAQGRLSKEIAEDLHISKFTVDTHRRNILAKSECSTINELIAKSIREGWI